MGRATRFALLAGAVSAASACNKTLVKGKMPVLGGPEIFLAGDGGEVNDGILTIRHNSGFTAFSHCETDWEPESIHMFPLLGKRMSFDVDLSRVGCACNLAFYLIGAPAKSYDGKFSPGTDRGGQPPYYCDANMVGGQWCPEMDIMEANTHVFQATAHSCDSAVNGHYFFCDRSGCDGSTKGLQGAYGPGSTFTIDTRKAFSVHTDFLEGTVGKLTGMITTLAQGRKTVVLDHGACKLEYFARVSDIMREGMSLRITYWGGDAQTMSWLDAPLCGNDLQCKGSNAGDALISQIEVAAVPQEVYAEQEKRLASQGTTTTVAAWAPGPPAATTKLPSWAWTEQYVADVYQPWQCHTYSNPRQEMSKWCVTAGFQEDGFEYQYNGGVGGPCGECFCCMRRAKKAWAPQTTPIPFSDDNVWMVVDPQDDRYGWAVPEQIFADRSLFVSLGKQGVAHWDNKFRYVRMVTRAQHASVANGGGLPFDNMIMQKYSAVQDQAWVQWPRLLLGLGVPGFLVMLLVVTGVAAAAFRKLRRVSSPATPPGTPRRGALARVPMTPSSLSSGSPAMVGEPSPYGPSPLRRNRSGGQMLLPRNSGSSQNLLWSITEQRSSSETNLAGMWNGGETMA